MSEPGGQGDRELACILALAHAGALSASELSAWVDAWVARCDAAPNWLIAACLASQTEDKLHHLREAAACPPVDPVLKLDAAVVGFDRGRLGVEELARVGLHLAWDHLLPEELSSLVYALDEDACCAHEFHGVPNSERVRGSVAALRAYLVRVSAWHATLETMCSGPDGP